MFRYIYGEIVEMEQLKIRPEAEVHAYNGCNNSDHISKDFTIFNTDTTSFGDTSDHHIIFNTDTTSFRDISKDHIIFNTDRQLLGDRIQEWHSNHRKVFSNLYFYFI